MSEMDAYYAAVSSSEEIRALTAERARLTRRIIELETSREAWRKVAAAYADTIHILLKETP